MLQQLPELPDLQHVLRTVPPSVAAPYARAHGEAIWTTVPAWLGNPRAEGAEWVSPAAYGAAWADALPVIQDRRPEFAAQCVRALDEAAGDFSQCFAEAAAARDVLV